MGLDFTQYTTWCRFWHWAWKLLRFSEGTIYHWNWLLMLCFTGTESLSKRGSWVYTELSTMARWILYFPSQTTFAVNISNRIQHRLFVTSQTQDWRWYCSFRRTARDNQNLRARRKRVLHWFCWFVILHYLTSRGSDQYSGTVKSVCLRAIIERLRTRYNRESVFVTASTGNTFQAHHLCSSKFEAPGIAAINVGGSTLHSFAGGT